MKSREVFRILSGKIEPVLTPLGFTRLKDPTGQIVGWTRPLTKSKNETVWCQLDKSPWHPWIGSRFVVELQQARAKAAGAINGAKRARLADLLTAEERREVQARQNRVVKKFRVPSGDEYSEFMGFPVADPEPFLDEYREACRPVAYGGGRQQDIWLRVLDADDVTAWGEFLAGWLPGALGRFAALRGAEYGW
jgi:hypothetical protein